MPEQPQEARSAARGSVGDLFRCARCGHSCCDHGDHHTGPCEWSNCDCASLVEPDASAATASPKARAIGLAVDASHARRRRFIEPGSATEVCVLMELIERREAGDWPLDHDSDEWKRIVYLLERSIGMHVIRAAFTELVDDEKILHDPDQTGEFGAAIAVSLDRDQFGSLTILVKLRQIDGAQLSYVLDVARRHELDVREEDGWLRLSPHLIPTDDETADEPEAALA